MVRTDVELDCILVTQFLVSVVIVEEGPCAGVGDVLFDVLLFLVEVLQTFLVLLFLVLRRDVKVVQVLVLVVGQVAELRKTLGLAADLLAVLAFAGCKRVFPCIVSSVHRTVPLRILELANTFILRKVALAYSKVIRVRKLVFVLDLDHLT